MVNLDLLQQDHWFIEQLAEEELEFSSKEVAPLCDIDGVFFKIKLPGLIIFSTPTAYLRAAHELQLRQDEIKEDFREGIVALLIHSITTR